MAKKQETEIVPVLPNQVSVLEQIALQTEPQISGNVYDIDIHAIHAHPQNGMFDSTDKEMAELRESIGQFGLLQTAIVNRRADGSLRMVSGHRRRQALLELGISTIRCEIVEVDDDAELVMLFHNNLGRGLKEHYKIRFFKVVKQFLRQFKQGIENTDTYVNDEMTNTLLVQMCTKRDDFKGKRLWEIIQSITGFTQREQEVLTHVCDEDYRNSVLSRIDAPAKRKRVQKHWEQLEERAMNGEISLVFLSNEVKELVRSIEQKEQGKTNAKAPSLPKAPRAEEDNTLKLLRNYKQRHAGMWAGRVLEIQKAESSEQIMECIDAILIEMLNYLNKGKK